MSVATEQAGVAPRRGFAPGWYRADRLLADRAKLEATIVTYGDGLGAPTTPVAAALAFKAYSYDVLEPVVTGWATQRRVLDLSLGQAFIRPTRAGYHVAAATQRFTVLPDDPMAGAPGVVVAADEAQLLLVLRQTLIDGHLAPAVEAFRAVRGGGARPLWGSVAQSLCYPVTIADVPDPMADVLRLLSILDPEVAALVEVADAHERGRWRPVLLRRTCCYAYALPSATLCSTCCLLDDERREAAFSARGARLRRGVTMLAAPPAGRSVGR